MPPPSLRQLSFSTLQTNDYDPAIATRYVAFVTIFVSAVASRRVLVNRHQRLLFASPLLFFPLANLFDDPGLQHRPLLSFSVAVDTSLSRAW